MKPIIRLITEQDIDATHTYFNAIFAEHLPTLITRERPQAPEASAEYIRSHLGDHSAIFIASLIAESWEISPSHGKRLANCATAPASACL